MKSFCEYLTSMFRKKQQFLQVNNSNFVTKNFRKAIIKRLKLRNKYLRERANEAKSLYDKQRNFCVSVLYKNMRDHFEKLYIKIVIDNGKFWKTIRPFFSEKAFHIECITLKESNKTVANNEELAETFNRFFS